MITRKDIIGKSHMAMQEVVPDDQDIDLTPPKIGVFQNFWQEIRQIPAAIGQHMREDYLLATESGKVGSDFRRGIRHGDIWFGLPSFFTSGDPSSFVFSALYLARAQGPFQHRLVTDQSGEHAIDFTFSSPHQAKYLQEAVGLMRLGPMQYSFSQLADFADIFHTTLENNTGRQRIGALRQIREERRKDNPKVE